MENSFNHREPEFVISPKFNFIYEMGMPSGKKMKNTTISLIIFVAVYVLFLAAKSLVGQISVQGMDVDKFSFIGTGILVIILILLFKLAIHIALQVMQYKNISYTFYDDVLVYEDKFLNQHKKTIRYENIKEVEIRRRIWDRMLGYGVIIIYTSAENNSKNGLVIYGIRDPQAKYEKIQDILQNFKNMERENVRVPKTEIVKDSNEVKEDETPEDFINNLKNLNN